VLIQQGKHDEAIASLKVDDLGAFAGNAHEIRGDAYVAKSDQTAARAEYAAALAATDAQIDRGLLELKLAEVGGSAPAPAAATKPEGQP
jgi:predicted negative regulator of RcsB-dependent stress response